MGKRVARGGHHSTYGKCHNVSCTPLLLESFGAATPCITVPAPNGSDGKGWSHIHDTLWHLPYLLCCSPLAMLLLIDPILSDRQALGCRSSHCLLSFACFLACEQQLLSVTDILNPNVWKRGRRCSFIYSFI